ncbi:hypothetical protein M5689_021121 [Euphorbia peplus]|nr:hypothetical protein M5689_021121 [Euphorbia peplus]
MMKLAAPKPFLFICVVILLSIVATLAHQDAAGKEPVWCPKEETFIGDGCEGYACLLDFMGKYGAGSMPKNCLCKPLGSKKRYCKCMIVCNN